MFIVRPLYSATCYKVCGQQRSKGVHVQTKNDRKTIRGERCIELWYSWVTRYNTATIVALLPIEAVSDQLLIALRAMKEFSKDTSVTVVSCRGAPSVRLEQRFANAHPSTDANLIKEVRVHASWLCETFNRSVVVDCARDLSHLNRATN